MHNKNISGAKKDVTTHSENMDSSLQINIISYEFKYLQSE